LSTGIATTYVKAIDAAKRSARGNAYIANCKCSLREKSMKAALPMGRKEPTSHECAMAEAAVGTKTSNSFGDS
jgi:hypothetical protein